MTPGVAVLCISVVILTFFIRRVVETAWPALTKKADENSPEMTYLTTSARWWNKVVLPAIPVLCGIGLSVANIQYFFQQQEGLEDVWARIFFGGGVAWMSSFLYKILRQVIKQRAGVTLPDDGTGADSNPGAGAGGD